MNVKSNKQVKSLEGSAYERDEASPGFLFWKAFNSWSRLIRVELERLDLTQVQYSILAAVSYLGSAQENVSQQDVANQLSMDKMMVSDVVKTLERKKMLQRKANPHDGRSFSLYLLPDARQRLKRAVPVVEMTDKKFFGVLKPEQLERFSSCLNALGNQGLNDR